MVREGVCWWAAEVGVLVLRRVWRCVNWTWAPALNDCAKDLPMVRKKPVFPNHSLFSLCGCSSCPA